MENRHKNLDKNGEKDDGDGSGDKKRLPRNVLRINEKHQSESDSTAKTTVRHDKLLDAIQLMQAEVVGEFSQQYNSCARHR
jgi:hypothetical protein